MYESHDIAIDTDSLLRQVSLCDDQDAFRSLFNCFYASLCLYAKRYVDDRSVREDIVQDVFSTVWERRKFIMPNTPVKSYLMSCVKNNSLNYLRRKGYFEEYQNNTLASIPLYAQGQDELYNLKELQELLAKTLEKLPEPYRLAFVMSRFEDKSSSEIAEIMNVSVRTVERYRARATEILKGELKDYLPLLLLLYLLSHVY
jgi:RNA polymerase sigma-70 factor (ECF subfamily)